ncbi:DNA polymerase III subunit beta [Malacoplasma penetrans HF-2]|uniref:DNA polymerase III subunit beta n=2 Tax=Malacoplasma penetrans TaxID=28227 RepID=Q8EX48_MALP2|nr:DNA polymerase III subunit beta [Malacoplasma penetrans HF-2]
MKKDLKMKIIVSKTKLINALRLCNSISENIFSSPVFLGTLIEVNDNEIKFTTSNGIISTHSIVAKSEDANILEKGRILIKTKPFFAIISKLKNEMITLEKVDNSVIKVKTSTFDSNINIMDEEQYPNINFSYNDWNQLSISPIVFKKSISKVKYAVNNNKEKINIMSGICFNSISSEKTLEIIATDGYKLAHYKFESTPQDFRIVLDVSLIELLLEIIDFDTNIEIFLFESNIIFKVSNTIIASKIIEGDYPNVSRIIATPKENKVNISKKTLVEALERGLAISSSEKKSIVKLNFSSEVLEVSFSSSDLGNSKETVSCKGKVNEPTPISLNNHFLLSLLKTFDNDNITVEFSDSFKPVLLRDEKDPNFLQILVPIRN